MKLPCEMIEDMLPMYADGECSRESASVIDAHLQTCPECGEYLQLLRNDEEDSELTVEDLKPLQTIQNKWRQGKREAFLKGVCITVGVAVLAVAVMIGSWYASYGKYFYQLTEKMERTTQEDRFFTSSDYTTVMNGHRFEVWLPIVLSENGFARVISDSGLVLFLNVGEDGAYTYRFYMTDMDNQSWIVYLKSDLTPDFESNLFPYRSEREKQHIAQMVKEQEADIEAMLCAVHQLWGLNP